MRTTSSWFRSPAAVERAVAAGALAVTKRGASGLPTAGEVEALLAGRAH